jgi:hypothetical protein
VFRDVQDRRRHTSGEKIFSSCDDVHATPAQEFLPRARGTPAARKIILCLAPTYMRRADLSLFRTQREMRRMQISTSRTRTNIRRAEDRTSRLVIVR